MHNGLTVVRQSADCDWRPHAHKACTPAPPELLVGRSHIV